MKIIIKPFSEIMIKSKPVRKRYLTILQQNIWLSLKKVNENIRTHFFWDKLEVNLDWEISELDLNEVKKRLSRMPWVEFFLETEALVLPELENEKNNEIFDFVFEKSKKMYLDKIKNKTFVVRVKRTWNHNFKSIDLERYVWGWLLKYWENCKVQLKKPEITVMIEIKDNNLFLVKEKIFGIGGYPTGTQDKIVSLISGWFDSGVSTYSMMKRWCKTDFLFFNLWGSAHELWVKQVAYYLRENFSSGYKSRFITINFEEVISELLTKVENKYRGVLLKRYFLKLADRLAQQHEYYAIVKWDSLGQVSSQTLKNMFVVDKASDTLVLRPLISSNKQEIIDITRKIGTYNFACNMPEYCWVISDKPSTWAKLEKIIKEEEKIEQEVLDRAFENIKVEKIDQVMSEINSREDKQLEISYLPELEEIIIDIREEDKVKKQKLNIENNQILEIPFFEINHKFKTLDQTKKYLFYCDKWVLSELHYLYLKELWFDNIKIYRPLEWSCELKKSKN